MTATSPGAGASKSEMLPLRHEDDLLGVFHDAFRPGATAVGIESERVGLFRDGRPLHFHGDPAHPGVTEVFTALVDRYAWRADIEKPGAPPLALLRQGASITLEPGSQFELSGAPFSSLHQVAAELDTHRAELESITHPMGLSLLGLGFHPFARQDDLDWVPKSRYPIMRRYLPTQGTYGLDMMRRTATVQANFDFWSEADAMRKLRVSLAASPVITALFANSAVVEGVKLPIKSYRSRVWLDMDNSRAGLLPFAWSPDARLGDYVRWALDIPMFIVKRGTEALDATSVTFRQFMDHGFQGLTATRGDWETHLNTLFPEVRLKRTLEVRGADSVPGLYAAGLPALWSGLLYDPDALAAAEALLVPFGLEAWTAVRPRVVAEGLQATVNGVSLATLCQKLLDLASTALARRAILDARGRDETVYLEPLKALAHDGRCVGDALLDGWNPSAPDAVTDLITRTRF